MSSITETPPKFGAVLAELAEEPEGLGQQLEMQSVWAGLFGEPEHQHTIGRFEVLRLLGRGGMGQVFAARDPELDRRVAIKLVTAASSNQAYERFMREGRALARLSHPNIVQVYEVGRHEGSMFIAMEMVEGQTLTRWAADDGTGKRRPWSENLRAYLDAGHGAPGTAVDIEIFAENAPAQVVADPAFDPDGARMRQ